MNKKIILLIPSLAIAIVLTAGTVQAFEGFGFGHKNIDPITAAQNFENRLIEDANLLGINLEEMKSYWAQGKNMPEIAKEKGITQEQLKNKMQTQRQAGQKEWLKTLVSQGKITQEQADSRLKAMQDRDGLMRNKKLQKKGHQGGCLIGNDIRMNVTPDRQ